MVGEVLELCGVEINIENFDGMSDDIDYTHAYWDGIHAIKDQQLDINKIVEIDVEKFVNYKCGTCSSSEVCHDKTDVCPYRAMFKNQCLEIVQADVLKFKEVK